MQTSHLAPKLRIEIARLQNENRQLREALVGLMEIAQMAMPDTYYTTDSRVVAARVALTENKA